MHPDQAILPYILPTPLLPYIKIFLDDKVEMSEGGMDTDTGIDEPVQSAYMKQQQRSADHWSGVRDQLLEASVEVGMLSSESLCSLYDERASISCFECGPLVQYCEDCAKSAHLAQNIFHRPLVWKV